LPGAAAPTGDHLPLAAKLRFGHRHREAVERHSRTPSDVRLTASISTGPGACRELEVLDHDVQRRHGVGWSSRFSTPSASLLGSDSRDRRA
jgi:hypothetical protein